MTEVRMTGIALRGFGRGIVYFGLTLMHAAGLLSRKRWYNAALKYCGDTLHDGAALAGAANRREDRRRARNRAAGGGSVAAS